MEAEQTPAPSGSEDLRLILEELLILLEEYGPVWYTEARRWRAIAALFSARTPDLHTPNGACSPQDRKFGTGGNPSEAPSAALPRA